jgi:hypothetical protein
MLRFWLIFACGLCLLLPLLAAETTAAKPPLLAATITLNAISTDQLMLVMTGLEKFRPEGVEAIVPLAGGHAVLVKARTAEAIAQVRQLIALFDKPLKRVVYQALFVSLPNDMRNTVGQWMENPASMQRKDCPVVGLLPNGPAGKVGIVSDKRVTLLGATKAVMRNGEAGFVESATGVSTLRGLFIANVTVHPDDSITTEVTPLLRDPTAELPANIARVNDAYTVIFRSKDRQPVVIMGQSWGIAPQDKDHFTVIFLVPFIMGEEDKADGKINLPPLF